MLTTIFPAPNGDHAGLNVAQDSTSQVGLLRPTSRLSDDGKARFFSQCKTVAVGRFCCRSRFCMARLGPKAFLDSAEAMVLRQPHVGAAALTLWTPTLRTERSVQARHATEVTGGGRTTSLARRLRFCAIAANVNSNCAPLGPRRRNRSSRRMRLRCANNISTFLR